MVRACPWARMLGAEEHRGQPQAGFGVPGEEEQGHHHVLEVNTNGASWNRPP